MIKLIALDLDGTTLDQKSQLPPQVRQALTEAGEAGIHVVIATGRVLSALPEAVLEVPGIRYALTSNGARIVDLSTGATVYKNCIAGPAAEAAVALLSNYNYMLEVFVDGHAYMEKADYESIRDHGISYRYADYVLNTREPKDGLLAFALAHKEDIENINVNFSEQAHRSRMWGVLGELKDVTLTTSFNHNIEIGGATTSKATALLYLAEELGVKAEEIMAMGDSPNDLAMLQVAGLPVAVGNAKPEVKAAAKAVVASNEEGGVAEAIRRFVLQG